MTRARKQHWCQLCADPIPAGSDYARHVLRPSEYVDSDGRWHTYRAHPLCHRLYLEWEWFDGAEPTPDPTDFRHEVLREPCNGDHCDSERCARPLAECDGQLTAELPS